MVQLDAEPVEAFEGAHGGGAHGYDVLAAVGDEAAEVVGGDMDGFDVHLVFADGVGADGFEGAGADVEGDVFGLDALGFQMVEYLGGEVETCRGGCHGAVVVGVDGLVAGGVGGFGFAVEVGRQGDDSGGLDDLGEGGSAGPLEVHHPGVAHGLAAGGGEGGSVAGIYVEGEGPGFPLLVVADEAGPGAKPALGEGFGDIHAVGFEAEDLNGGAGLLLEEEAGMDDFGVVEGQEGVLRQEVREVVEVVLRKVVAAEAEELGVVALREGVFGDAVVGQGVVVVLDADVLQVTQHVSFAAKT